MVRKNNEGDYLEVQRGLNIHYKVFSGVETFRKPQGRKQSEDSLKRPRHNSTIDSLLDEDIPTPVVRLSSGAEKEQDVTDGMEELECRASPEISVIPKHKEPTKIVFMLLHSFLGCTGSWDRVIQSLRQYGTVITFDRLGFGLSSKPIPTDDTWMNCSLEALACSFGECADKDDDDSGSEGLRGSSPTWINPYSDLYSAHIIMRLLHHVLDHSKPTENKGRRRKMQKNKMNRTITEKRTIILVGHSLGGRLALNTCFYFPPGFSGLILVNPALFTNAASVPGFSPNLFRQVGTSFFRFLPNLLPPPIAYHDFEDTIKEDDKCKYKDILKDDNWLEAIKQWGKYHFSDPGLNPERVLLRMNIPILVTAGDNDKVVSSSDCRKILKILKNTKAPGLYAEFQLTGHCPMEEKPMLFISVVEKFLNNFIKDISYEKGLFTGSTSSVIAAYRNQHQDPFRQGCIVMDNITGELSLLCGPDVQRIPKSLSIPKDLDEIALISQ